MVKDPFWIDKSPIDCTIGHKDVEFPGGPIGAMIKSAEGTDFISYSTFTHVKTYIYIYISSKEVKK